MSENPQARRPTEGLTAVVHGYLHYGYTDYVVPPRPGGWAKSGFFTRRRR
jgi:hypothetical protein